MARSEWRIVMPEGKFDALRSDRRVQSLLSLARVTNALTLGRWALLAPLKWQSPRMRRERYAALLYTGALLHEGLRFAESLARHFKHLPQFSAGLAPIIADSSVQRLRKRYLKPLRNKIAFHFDAVVPLTSLPRLKNSGFVFACGRGNATADIYFELADDVVTDYLLGSSSTDEGFVRKFEEFAVGTSELYKRFMIASHRLIPAALKELGWRRAGRSRSAGAA
jgi:hypothetical protein